MARGTPARKAAPASASAKKADPPAAGEGEGGSPVKQKAASSAAEKKKDDNDDVDEDKGKKAPAKKGSVSAKGGAKGKADAAAAADEDAELSEEDKELRSQLEMLVERLKESDATLYKPTLETLRTLIRDSTSSMTSVPKPLKFLRPHYGAVKDIFAGAPWQAAGVAAERRLLADILSTLAMTYAEEGKRESLKFKLLGTDEPIGSWGHEYVRHLAAEIIGEYNARQQQQQPTETEGDQNAADAEGIADLIGLVDQIIPFCLSHNAEADACDLLVEIEQLRKLPEHVNAANYARVCMYLTACVNYVPTPDDIAILETVFAIYRAQSKLAPALNIAIRLNARDKMSECLAACGADASLKRQLVLMLARQQIKLDVSGEDEGLEDLLNNAQLSSHFTLLGKELDVSEAKTPEDIYKTHLEPSSGLNRFGFGASVDSAKANLAATFVNAFVNAGFKNDKLVLPEDESQSWIYKNKDSGMLSATASIGMAMLWDVEAGLAQIDKYLYSNDPHIKAGALLAIGIVNSGVRNDSDPALALLSEHLENKDLMQRLCAINGLGLAYAGSYREDVAELLLPLVADTANGVEVVSAAVLALGLVFVGSLNDEVISGVLEVIMERDAAFFKDAHARFLALGFSLLFLGEEEASEAALETLKVVEAPIVPQVRVLVTVAAYAGTGNVLKVQEMLHVCNDRLDAEKTDATHQGLAVLGIALIAMGEDIGLEMALRSFNHLMQYGEQVIRRAVPLALSLLCASNPLVHVLDTLSKYSHDADQEVSMNACLALGVVGAGTNNARLAQLLRQLAVYYAKESGHLFVVRVAQGLLHMGKGTISVKPYHSDRFLLSPVAVGGLLTALVAMTEPKALVLGKYHFYLYHVVLAMYPRFLVTLDEQLQPLPVSVRVGQAVDVVGQAGRPKTITGFQTHTTPVLLAHAERAELATEEYISLAAHLEGIVILRKNPAWTAMDENR